MKRLLPLCLALLLTVAALSGGGTALAALNGPTDADIALIEEIDVLFTEFETLSEAVDSDPATDTEQDMETLLEDMRAYCDTALAIAGDLDALKKSQINEIENLRTACSGHVRIQEFMVREYLTIIEYSIAMMEVVGPLETIADDLEQLPALREKVAAFKKHKAPDSMKQTHESLCRIFDLALYAFEDVIVAAALDDQIRMMAAQCEIEPMIVQITLMTADIAAYADSMSVNSEKAGDKLDTMQEALRARIDEIKERYGLMEETT